MINLIDTLRNGRGLTWTFEAVPGTPVQCSAGISEDGTEATGSVRLTQRQFGPGVKAPIYAVSGSREAVKSGMKDFLTRLQGRLFDPEMCR